MLSFLRITTPHWFWEGGKKTATNLEVMTRMGVWVSVHAFYLEFCFTIECSCPAIPGATVFPPPWAKHACPLHSLWPGGPQLLPAFCSLTLTSVKMGYHHNPALLSNLYRELLPLEQVMELFSAQKDGEQASSAPVTVVTIGCKIHCSKYLMCARKKGSGMSKTNLNSDSLKCLSPSIHYSSLLALCSLA